MQATAIDLDQYRRDGYVARLPVLEGDELIALNRLYDRLCKLLPEGESSGAIDWWHQIDSELYAFCTHPVILEYAEQIIGPDFFLWGSQFFSKEPGEGSTVPWHQDAYYWPIRPHQAVTVWLAVNDSFPENGAMKVIPGTHTRQIKHTPVDNDTDVLDQKADQQEFEPSEAIYLSLQAGECSLHDDNILHGSDRNTSNQRRCGLTIRFSAGTAKCDTSVWPFFKAYWVRGEDQWGHNPLGEPPTSVLTEYMAVTPRTGQR